MKRPSFFDAVSHLALPQHGLVTIAQAERVGRSAEEVLDLVAKGAVVEIADGVVRVPSDSPPIPLIELWAAWLQLSPAQTASERVSGGGQPDAVVSHVSAAAVYNLGVLDADIHRFTVSREMYTGRDDVQFYPAPLSRRQWSLVDGLPVLKPIHMIVQLHESRIDSTYVGDMIREGLYFRMFQRPELVRLLGAIDERFSGEHVVQELLDVSAGGFR